MAAYSKRPLWQLVLIYLLVGGLVYWLIYYFVFAKNGNGYQMGKGYNYGTTPEAMSSKVTITLAELNGSGESGTAMLEEVDGKVTVTVNLTGYPKDGTPQPAHLHVGECPGVGAVKYPITSLVNGTSVTMLDVTLAQLKSELPLALNVHKSAAEAKVYTACGGLSL
jgi:hypothetical protein